MTQIYKSAANVVAWIDDKLSGTRTACDLLAPLVPFLYSKTGGPLILHVHFISVPEPPPCRRKTLSPSPTF
jgi:hypothetical protein